MRLPPSVQEHEDTTWQTIYMDLITALLILFLILWAIHQGATDDEDGFGNRQTFAMRFDGDNTFKAGSAEMLPEFEKDLDRLLFGGNVETVFGLGFKPDTGRRNILIINGHSSKDFQGKSISDIANQHYRNMDLSLNRAFSMYKKTNRELAHRFKDPEKLTQALENISVCGHSFNFQSYVEKKKNQRVTFEMSAVDPDKITEVYP